jgi:hypothetical protein
VVAAEPADGTLDHGLRIQASGVRRGIGGILIEPKMIYGPTDPEMQHIVNGQRTFMETCSLPALNEDGADIIVEAMAKAVSAGCVIFTHEFRGAASRVPVEATAFGFRRNHVLIEILASFPDRSDRSEERRHQQWVRDTRRAFDAVALPGGYPNLLGIGDADRAAENFGPNVERLVRLKQLYDPDNVFCSAIPLPSGQRAIAAA